MVNDRLPDKSDKVFPFVVGVALFDTPEEQFVFDQDEVVIGRSPDADLHVAHPAISRRQLTIQRILPKVGRPRFRIVPEPAAKNQVLVNGVPAVEGSIVFGDVVAVAETRLTLRKASGVRRTLNPMRLAIAGSALVALVLVVLALTPARHDGGGPSLPQVKLFVHLPRDSCADAVTCGERARTAYTHGRTHAKQAASVPGGWYHAAIEFYRAYEFQRLSGTQIAGLEDVRERLRVAATSAESIYNDLQFRLARDLRANNPEALRETINLIVLVVPDEEHPLRVHLNQFLREHPLPPKPGAK
ncbi:MAG: Inner rane component of cytoplasmic domain [bacterium]|nr:Inner rane component of cytoplasmic domain [bacterium]